LSVKAAWIDGQIADAKMVSALAALPPKIELLSRLVGTLKSPMSGLVMVLSGNQSGLVRALNAIREQKSAAAGSAA
jgi:large subunit ribosomal protein L10